jgi:hypothetical protein
MTEEFKMAVVQTDKYSLNKYDLKSLGIGLGITLAGAALTFLSEYVSKADFGSYSPMVVAVFALLVNIVRKYLSETEYIK